MKKNKRSKQAVKQKRLRAMKTRRKEVKRQRKSKAEKKRQQKLLKRVAKLQQQLARVKRQKRQDKKVIKALQSKASELSSKITRKKRRKKGIKPSQKKPRLVVTPESNDFIEAALEITGKESVDQLTVDDYAETALAMRAHPEDYLTGLDQYYEWIARTTGMNESEVYSTLVGSPPK